MNFWRIPLGMFAKMHFFRLSDEGVRCDQNGLFVGSVPLLVQVGEAASREGWTARSTDELDQDLTACYGLPIDTASKRAALAGVARALDRGEMTLAKIGAVLLGFPDPPCLAKDVPAPINPRLEAALSLSGLLKAYYWDPAKHPRAGERPNPGWFVTPANATEPEPPTQIAPQPSDPSPVQPDPQLPTATEPKQNLPTPREQPKPSPRIAPWREILRTVRGLLKAEATTIIEAAQAIAWTATKIKEGIEINIAILEAMEQLNPARRAAETARASLDPPKWFEELQYRPMENALGYDRHHLVEQNPANIEKTPAEIELEKFGRTLIDDRSNLVWVPRLKHELITGYYNSKVSDDPGALLRRAEVNKLDFGDQRAYALRTLRMFGVLK
jgi:hypothetical protein